MGVLINKNYPCNTTNYGDKRNDSSIKYIVIHYTGNRNDRAISNCKYFQSPNRNASAHYFVDEESIYQSVSPSYVAWSVGGNKYSNCSSTGGGKYYGKCTNANSISIEMCNAVDNVNDKTKSLVFGLIKELMNTYNIPTDNIIRHFDVTGKDCPHSLVNNSHWNIFKGELNDYLKGVSVANTTKVPPIQKQVTVNVNKSITSTLDTINISIDGKKTKVNRIMIADENYIRLKDLDGDLLEVSYDEENKLPLIKIKK